jgi:hypothetical protein
VLACWPGGTRSRQLAVPDGPQSGVELPGVLEQLFGTVGVVSGVRGPGGQDQAPGGDLVAVLLPQLGPGRVQGSGLVGQLPGLVQVPSPVRLIG